MFNSSKLLGFLFNSKIVFIFKIFSYRIVFIYSNFVYSYKGCKWSTLYFKSKIFKNSDISLWLPYNLRIEILGAGSIIFTCISFIFNVKFVDSSFREIRIFSHFSFEEILVEKNLLLFMLQSSSEVPIKESLAHLN
jgi:hypothetical protein